MVSGGLIAGPIAVLGLVGLVMYLRRLHLRQFRNYGDRAIAFDAPKTILVGDNAQGKSNVLEAVELLATLQSHRTSRDGDLIQEGAAIATVQGQIERQSSGSMDLELILRRGGRRTVALNGQGLRRQADGLGTLNAVLFSCLDLELVRGGPERRRAWLDGLLLQLEPLYSHILGQYNRVLRQRNALLRQQVRGDRRGVTEPESTDDHAAELALWDAQLAIAAARVVRRRARALALLAPRAAAWHRDIGGGSETLDITYVPNGAIAPDLLEGNEGDRAIAVQQAFLKAIHEKATAERHQGTSLIGPHRDDIDLRVNGVPARQFGSQGQQRTLVLALKLAELTTLEELLGEPPLLLLDDVLAELDLKRQDRLLGAIAERFQTLVTATHLGAFDGRWLDGARILTVRRGQIDATG